MTRKHFKTLGCPMPASLIYGPRNPHPDPRKSILLTEVQAYAYAVAKLHAAIEIARRPATDMLATPDLWAECEFRHYISWAIQSHGLIRTQVEGLHS